MSHSILAAERSTWTARWWRLNPGGRQHNSRSKTPFSVARSTLQMLESSGMRLVGFQSTSISAGNGAGHDLHQGTDQQGDKNSGGKQEFANKLSLLENELSEDNKSPSL